MSSLRENLIKTQVALIEMIIKRRIDIINSKLALLNKQKADHQIRLKRADDQIQKLENDLALCIKNHNAHLNKGGIVAKDFFPHHKENVKVFRSQIAQAIKARERIILDIKNLEKEIQKEQAQAHAQEKRKTKFELFHEIQHN